MSVGSPPGALRFLPPFLVPLVLAGSSLTIGLTLHNRAQALEALERLDQVERLLTADGHPPIAAGVPQPGRFPYFAGGLLTGIAFTIFACPCSIIPT